MSFNVLILLFIIVLIICFICTVSTFKGLGHIENYQFNAAIGKKVKERYPHLSNDQIELVLTALKDYFYMCNQSGSRVVAMPSQVVDVAWHEFILHTREYQAFCENALGRFLHHTPSEAMSSPTVAQEGIKRAWRLACYKQGINPKTPAQLPLVFAIDAQLKIDDGFKYSLDCEDQSSSLNGKGFCAKNIGCVSGCMGESGSKTNTDAVDRSSSGCGGD